MSQINVLYNELAKLYNQKGKSRNGLKRTAKANLFIGYNEITHTYFVQYHATRIIKIQKDGTLFLDNGEWYTISTKKHMNLFLSLLDIHIRQVKGAWFLNKNKQDFHYYNEINVDTLGKHPLDLRIGA